MVTETKPKTGSVAGTIINVRHGAVIPDPDQPRKTFDEQGIKELSESIESNGLLQPITVRPHKDSTARDKRYILIAGERRWRAVGLLGWETIPAIVRKALTDEQSAKLQLLENIVREDLNAVEEAEAMKRMVDSGYTTAEIIDAGTGA